MLIPYFAARTFGDIKRIATFFLLGLGATTAHAGTSAEENLEALRAADIRVASVGERLAVANVQLCRHTIPRSGLILHDIRQYSIEAQTVARSTFGFVGDISVEGVVPGGPADRAGIKAGYGLLAIDGTKIAALPSTRPENSFERMAALLEEEERQAADGVLVVDLLEQGIEQRRIVVTERGCSGRFQLVFEGSRNAFSDGRYIQIDGRMIDFVRNDEELSAVLAHELAHVILDHHERLYPVSNGGAVRRAGRRAIRASEDEADRLSLYLMANAGYNPTVAPDFWDHLEKSSGLGILSDGTHAGRKTRVAMMAQELANLDRLREDTPAGIPLFPTFAQRPFPSLH